MPWNATPERPLVLLYDGTCRFCVAGKSSLLRLAQPGTVLPVDGKNPVELARFPQVSAAAMNNTLQLVSPDGCLAQGAEAVARTLNTRPAWRLITWLYWLPGVRQLSDVAYGFIARHRYRIAGRITPCDSDTCSNR